MPLSRGACGIDKVPAFIMWPPLLNLESVSYLFDDLQIVNYMKNNTFSTENAEAKSYASPICQVIDVDIQRVICASGTETEKVTETDGEW